MELTITQQLRLNVEIKTNEQIINNEIPNETGFDIETLIHLNNQLKNKYSKYIK